MLNRNCLPGRAVFLLAGLAVVAMLGTPQQQVAAAQVKAPSADADRDRQVRERLVIAGRQRMLAEALAAKLCFAEAGVTPDESRNELYVMWNIFGWYHQGFRKGNRELELGPELNRDVLQAWQVVDADWREDAGVLKPPNRRIAQSLADGLSHWRPVAAFAYASAAGQQLGPFELSEFAGAMNLFIVSMSAAITDLALHQNRERGKTLKDFYRNDPPPKART